MFSRERNLWRKPRGRSILKFHQLEEEEEEIEATDSSHLFTKLRIQSVKSEEALNIYSLISQQQWMHPTLPLVGIRNANCLQNN